MAYSRAIRTGLRIDPTGPFLSGEKAAGFPRQDPGLSGPGGDPQKRIAYGFFAIASSNVLWIGK